MLSYFRDLLTYLSPDGRASQPSLSSQALHIHMLHEIVSALNSSMHGIEQTLNLVAEAVTALLDAERSLVLLQEESRPRLRVSATSGMVDCRDYEGLWIPSDIGIFGACLRERRPMRGMLNEQTERVAADFYRSLAIDHFIAAPMYSGERRIGVVVADRHRGLPPFSDNDLKLLVVLAHLGAVACENASLITSLRAKNSRLNALLEVSRALSSTLELAPLCRLILDQAVELTRSAAGVLLLYDATGEKLDVRCAKGVPDQALDGLELRAGEGISGWVLLEGRSLRVPDVHQDPRYIEIDPRVKSEMAVPIVYDEQIVGVINVDSFEENAYSELDQRLMETLAAQAAIAVRNADQFQRLRNRLED